MFLRIPDGSQNSLDDDGCEAAGRRTAWPMLPEPAESPTTFGACIVEVGTGEDEGSVALQEVRHSLANAQLLGGETRAKATSSRRHARPESLGEPRMDGRNAARGT